MIFGNLVLSDLSIQSTYVYWVFANDIKGYLSFLTHCIIGIRNKLVQAKPQSTNLSYSTQFDRSNSVHYLSFIGTLLTLAHGLNNEMAFLIY